MADIAEQIPLPEQSEPINQETVVENSTISSRRAFLASVIALATGLSLKPNLARADAPGHHHSSGESNSESGEKLTVLQLPQKFRMYARKNSLSGEIVRGKKRQYIRILIPSSLDEETKKALQGQTVGVEVVGDKLKVTYISKDSECMDFLIENPNIKVIKGGPGGSEKTDELHREGGPNTFYPEEPVDRSEKGFEVNEDESLKIHVKGPAKKVQFVIIPIDEKEAKEKHDHKNAPTCVTIIQDGKKIFKNELQGRRMHFKDLSVGSGEHTFTVLPGIAATVQIIGPRETCPPIKESIESSFTANINVRMDKDSASYDYKLTEDNGSNIGMIESLELQPDITPDSFANNEHQYEGPTRVFVDLKGKASTAYDKVAYHANGVFLVDGPLEKRKYTEAHFVRTEPPAFSTDTSDKAKELPDVLPIEDGVITPTAEHSVKGLKTLTVGDVAYAWTRTPHGVIAWRGNKDSNVAMRY